MQSEEKSQPPILWRILAVPLVGAALVVAVVANEIGTGWVMNPSLHELAARMLALTMLMRIVAKEYAGATKPTANWPMAALSVGAFSYAAWIMHYQEWTDSNTTRALLFATVGSAAGMCTYLRALTTLRWCSMHPTAVFIAFVLGICPTVFYSFHLVIWQQTSGMTVAMVKAILRLFQIATTSGFQSVANVRGDAGEENLNASIQSTDFGLSISWECSGLEGGLLFCTFISVFLLYDWHLFGRMKGLWVIYLFVIPLLLAVNAIRISSIFLYAEWLLAHGGNSHVASDAIGAFHSNAGLVWYTAVFALILPLLYRWARRRGDVRRSSRSDGRSSQ